MVMTGALQRLKLITEQLVPVSEKDREEALFHVASYYIPVDSESEECRNHSNFLLEGVINNDVWALEILDASSKVNAGVMGGSLMDLGSYDQCLGVSVPKDLFKGQLCVVETRGLTPSDFDRFNPKQSLPALRTDIVFSLCVPSTCTVDDVKTHLQVSLSPINATAILYDTSCSSSHSKPFQPIEYVTMLILVLIILLVSLSTWYENRVVKGQEPLLCSFSLSTNTRQLLSVTRPDHSLPCLDGLRVLAMGWIIFGHRVLHQLTIPNISFRYLDQSLKHLWWAPAQQVILPVEIFFLLSGTLVTYHFMRKRHSGKPFNYATFIAKRYCRLSVPVAFVILLYSSVLWRLSDGPIWMRLFGVNHHRCRSAGWINLLYINNYMSPLDSCLTQTWYLAVDFQLHVLSPILLLPLYKNPCWGLFLSGLAFASTNIASFVNLQTNNVLPRRLMSVDRTDEEKFAVNYMQTQYRASSFVVGVVVGYVVFRIKQGQLYFKLSKVGISVVSGIATILIIIPFLYWKMLVDNHLQHFKLVNILGFVLQKPSLSIGVAFVVVISTLQRGGFVRRVLSSPKFLPLSRLSYCAFLVHFFVQDIQTYKTQTTVHTNMINILYLFMGDLIISYLIAAVLYLAVECPACNITKILFRGS